MTLGQTIQSEIRDSEITALSERVSKRKYQSYLLGMRLAKLRAYKDASIRFDFPVTALVGPNGGGKTTVLGAAALIFKEIAPRRFFAKSGKYDASMKSWKVEYELWERDPKKNVRAPTTRTASYVSSKWSRDALSRKILLFGVTRTIPASERKDLTSFIGGSFKSPNETQLSTSTVEAVEKILGKEAQNYLLVALRKGGLKNLYAAVSPNGDAYSEFHFGAGEASVIRIVADIEQSPDESLILIEEIENGLHPVATKRLVEYLIKVAKRKSCQIIFTTHSNDALAPLPDQAVWSCAEGELTQGKLDVNSLRALTGKVEASLAIFVEDAFGEQMALAALREYRRRKGISLLGLAIHAVGGHGNAAKFAKIQNQNPAINFKAMAILDGDMRGQENHEELVVCFPGESSPEDHVARAVESKLDIVAARLALNLNLPTSDQVRVAQSVKERLRTNQDPHVLFEQVGNDLDFIGAAAVQRAFLTQWAEQFPDEVDAIFDPVVEYLPKEGSFIPQVPKDNASEEPLPINK
jgi:ABC-type multidrug transport system ATPase subunit